MVHFGLVFLMMRAGNLFLLNLEFSIFSARYFRSMSCSSDILPYETTFWTIGLWLDIGLKVKNKYKKCTIIRRIWAPKFEVVYFFRHMRKDEFIGFFEGNYYFILRTILYWQSNSRLSFFVHFREQLIWFVFFRFTVALDNEMHLTYCEFFSWFHFNKLHTAQN